MSSQKFNQKSLDWLSSLPEDEVAKMVELYDKYLNEVNAAKAKDSSKVYAYDGNAPFMGFQSTQNRRYFDEVVAKNAPQRGPSTTGVPALNAEDIYSEYNKRKSRARALSNMPQPIPAQPFAPYNMSDENGYNPTFIKQPKAPAVFPVEAYSMNNAPAIQNNQLMADHEPYSDPTVNADIYRNASGRSSASRTIRGEMIPSKEVMRGAGNKFSYPQMFNSGDDYTKRAVSDMVTREAASRSIRKPLQNDGEMRMVLQDGTVVVRKSSKKTNNDKLGWWTNPELLAKANKSTEMSRLAGRPNASENEAKDMIRQFWASNPELHKNLLEYRTKNREFDIRKFEALQEVSRQQIASEGGVKQAEIIRGQSDSAKFIDYASNMAAARNYREAQKASRLAEIFDKQQKAAEEDSAELHGVAVESFQRLLKGELADLKEANPNMPDYNVADYNESISRLLKTKGASDLIVKKMSEGQTLKQILDRVYSLPQHR